MDIDERIALAKSLIARREEIDAQLAALFSARASKSASRNAGAVGKWATAPTPARKSERGCRSSLCLSLEALKPQVFRVAGQAPPPARRRAGGASRYRPTGRRESNSA